MATNERSVVVGVFTDTVVGKRLSPCLCDTGRESAVSCYAPSAG
ncbi:MAG: hypothetical protein ACJ8CB_31850 [Ktedonobacteraceae bacterium]